MNVNNIILMSHNDLDGWMANTLLAVANEVDVLDVRNLIKGDFSTPINTDYKGIDKVLESNLNAFYKLDDDELQGLEFHIVDLGMSPEQLDKLNELGKKMTVRLFDHHVGSMEGCESGKYPNIKFQTWDTKCGSMIYYDFLSRQGAFDHLNDLSKELLLDLMDAVNQHDLHVPNPRILSKILGDIPEDDLRDELEDIIDNVLNGHPMLTKDLLIDYQSRVEQHNKRLLKALKSTVLIGNKGKKYLSLNYRDNIDYLSDEIFAILKDIDYLEFVEDGTVSLRGNKAKGFEVLPIAKSKGGGGHPYACGYRL